MLQRPSGIHAMQFALFDSDERLDRASMHRQVEGCIAAGAHGIAILGLATEAARLSDAERRALVEWTIESSAGRRPITVTAPYPSTAEQIAFVRFIENTGAKLAILQPPPVHGLSEIEYIRYFGRIADASNLPVGIQNAPDLIGVGLSATGLKTLTQHHPNIVMIKEEKPAIAVRNTILALGDDVAVFNGRGGLELIENLDFGCAGMIPGSETIDIQVAIFDLLQVGDEQSRCEAERLYRELLPLLVFLFQSLESFLVYAKLLAAQRLGLAVHPRWPTRLPSEAGRQNLARLSRHLPAFP